MSQVRFTATGVRRVSVLACALLGAAAAGVARADAYDPPSNYYAAATGTGSALKGQLYTITSTGFIGRSYGDARYAFANLDRDPANSSRILLAYNRASVSGTWDQGATFNREHVWPKSLLGVGSISNDYTGIASDMFELRPTNTAINSDRGNLPYGLASAPKPAGGFGVVNGQYYYPGDADRGDVARSIFYMATRYGQGQSNNLSLKNGQASTYQMGDLDSLLRWHYQDEVDTFERRRNHYVHSAAVNPTYYQNNRNPFIDHPEYVWTIFGGSANTSQLTVAAPAANGGSTATVDMGRVIVGSSFGTRSITLAKSGSTPTTYDVVAGGNATTSIDGPRHSFDYGTQSRSVTVGLSGGTASVGPRSGTITFDNTDLTSASTGQGSTDANDVVNVSGTVVAHAAASFASGTAVHSKTIDFGIVAQGASDLSLDFQITNLPAAGAGIYTASLDLDAVTATGTASAFSTTLTAPQQIAAGSARTYIASLTASQLGQYSSLLNIATSDENIPGATSLTPLQLTLQARIATGGDTNLDGAVDFSDLLTLAQNYGAGLTTWSTGDFTRDGLTSFDDLLTLAQRYGSGLAAVVLPEGASPSFTADWALAQSLVPEPSVASLALIGAAMLGRRRQ